MNLAVCLAPSLFHLNLLKKESSPRWVFLNKNANPKPGIPQGYLKKNYMHCTSTWGSVSTSFIIRKCLEEPDSCGSGSENYPGSIEECPLWSGKPGILFYFVCLWVRRKEKVHKVVFYKIFNLKRLDFRPKHSSLRWSGFKLGEKWINFSPNSYSCPCVFPRFFICQTLNLSQDI